MFKNLLLTSYSVNFPIIEEFKLTCGMPIALIFKEWKDHVAYVNTFSPEPKIISGSTSVDEAYSYLEEANSEPVFVIPLMENGRQARSGKMDKKIDAAFCAAQMHKVDGKPAYAAIYMLFHKLVPKEYKSGVFEIHIDSQTSYSYFPIESLLPSPDQISLVQEEFTRITDKIPGIEWLYISAAFLYPRLKEAGRLDIYQNLLNEIPKMEELSALYQEDSDITEMTLERLLDFAFEEGFQNHIKLPHVPEDISDDEIKKTAFYTNNSLFIHNNLFQAIMNPLMKCIPETMIKSCLDQSGILISDKGSYTTKIRNCSNPNVKNKRMLRFDIQKIQMQGKPSMRDYFNHL